MRAVNRFNVTHFWNPHVLRIPNWYDTCLVMKIFTIGLPAECVLFEMSTNPLNIKTNYLQCDKSLVVVTIFMVQMGY